MLSFTPHKGACTGCSACMAACPVNCITMETDQEGFWYPVSSDACINCGKCERVCPYPKHEKTANHYEQKAYACLSKDYKIWKRSASGGAFSEICLSWGDDKTIVVGAAWDGLMVHHICIEGIQNIEPLCKSKYVASHPKNTFSEIKEYLKDGRKVIFCGTPCQVAGLKAYLGNEHNNLLTIDLICHGVGSPDVFRDAVRLIEEQYNISNVNYEFRSKRCCYEKDHITSVYNSEKKLYLENDQYMQLFLKQLCLRPSCGNNCVFRDSNRQGDLTIADFKGLEIIYPELKNSKRNYSTIVTNSSKGTFVVELLRRRAIIKEAALENVKQFNPLFYRHTWASTDRDVFFEEYARNPKQTIRKYTTDSTLNELTFKKRIKFMMPRIFINFLSKIR